MIVNRTQETTLCLSVISIVMTEAEFSILSLPASYRFIQPWKSLSSLNVVPLSFPSLKRPFRISQAYDMTHYICCTPSLPFCTGPAHDGFYICSKFLDSEFSERPSLREVRLKRDENCGIGKRQRVKTVNKYFQRKHSSILFRYQGTLIFFNKDN